MPGVPPSLQGPTLTQNTPRALIVNRDLTTRGFFNADFNQTLEVGGYHMLKGGVGVQRTVNDAAQAYPGGYVNIFWDRDFVFQGNQGRGTYGYYEVNDRGVQGKAGANIVSLYVQDQWTVGDRLTLNLGLRTESENVPSFREGVNALEFGFGDKLAPRLGAAYDVRGDGKFKIYGSWGKYYDWTKYELARGSYGGDTWHIFYRGLDTLDLASLNLSNMPGADLWVVPGGFRDRRVPNFESTDPDIKPMSQTSTSVGAEYQLNPTLVATVHYVHNDLTRTIEDIGAVDASGNEAYIIGNPGEGLARLQFPSGATPVGQPVPAPKRQYDALEFQVSRRFAGNYFWSASYVYSRLYGNYSGIAATEEVRTPTTDTTSATAQQQVGSIARPGGNANRAWDIDEIFWDSHGTLDVLGRLPTDRPHVVKLYRQLLVADRHADRCVLLRRQRHADDHLCRLHEPDAALRRGSRRHGPHTGPDADRPAAVTGRQSGRREKLRLELNVLNVFNQKATRHIFNFLNRGAGGNPRPSSAIDLSRVDLGQGYDYDAMIRNSADGMNAYDPRYGMADLFDAGTVALVTFKFLF